MEARPTASREAAASERRSWRSRDGAASGKTASPRRSLLSQRRLGLGRPDYRARARAALERGARVSAGIYLVWEKQQHRWIEDLTP